MIIAAPRSPAKSAAGTPRKINTAPARLTRESRLSCRRGIRKTSGLEHDSSREAYLLQKLDCIFGCGNTWVQSVVKDLRQLRILDKMEREKLWPQQVLQLDVVCGHEHLRVRTEAREDRLTGGNSLRCIGAAKELIDNEYSLTVALCPLHKGQDSFQLSEEMALTRLHRMLCPNQGHDARSGDD